MIQIGNEINPGMLLPDGSTSNWKNLPPLLKQGARHSKRSSAAIQVMLHIANAGDQSGTRKWFDQAGCHGVSWDVTGLSYYSYWHGTTQALTGTVKEMIAQYGKPVVIVETAYPFTLLENDEEQNSIHSLSQLTPGYPATPRRTCGQSTGSRAGRAPGRGVGILLRGADLDGGKGQWLGSHQPQFGLPVGKPGLI